MASRPHLDLDNYLPYLINRVGSAIAEIYTGDTLAPLGLSLDMWRVLAALSNNGEQRLVTRMVRQGLVTRTRSKTSSREVVVALSAKGRAQVESLIPIAKRLEVTAADGLPPWDLAVFKRALRRMYVNLTNGRRRTR